MAFDADKTLQGMIKAISGVLTGEWTTIKACVQSALEYEKDAISDIAQARIKNEINDEDMKRHLDNEKLALESALLACQVKAKMADQNADNDAIDVLNKAIKAAL